MVSSPDANQNLGKGLAMKRLILTDQSIFKDIRKKNAVYIDKTEQIYNVLQRGSHFFLARPRRFGKSLLCSTLASLFEAERDLFKGLWIDNSDWQWNKHPVIYLDMAEVAGRNRTATSMKERISEILSNKATAHELTLSRSDNPEDLLSSLIEKLHQKYNVGVVVIIDEYDKPVLDLVDNPIQRNEIHKLLASFYAPLKTKGSLLSLAFMTGVYKFAKTSIFSNLNHLIDLTFTPLAATIVGYTQEELETNFSLEIDTLASKTNVSREEMLITLQEQYNGYRFGVTLSDGALSPSVYNSFGINNVFAANDLIKRWFASGSPSFLIEKVKAGTFATFAQEGISMDFGTLDASCAPDAITAESLLYYAGYATMTDYDPRINYVTLKYPNKEVAHAMATQMMPLFSRTGNQTALSKLIKDLALSFFDNSLDRVKEILNQALAQFSYSIMLPYEDYFQSLLFLLLQAGNLDVYPEVQTNSTRLDIVVKTPATIFILELKFNRPAIDGLNQIIKKQYFQRYLALNKPIIAMGISFTLKDDAKGDEPLQNRAVSDVTWVQIR
jgi:hypothetical protein